MGISDSRLQPEELISFKGLAIDIPLEDIEIPERPENRKLTNKLWLIILGVVVIVFLPFMIYTLCYSDIDRILKGYDKCGNICGKENKPSDNIPCSGQNWNLSPYLQYDAYFLEKEDYQLLLQERHCVQSCKKGYIAIWGRCLKIQKDDVKAYSALKNDVNRIKHDFDMAVYLDGVKEQIIISCLLSFLVSMGILFMFKYTTTLVIWGILIGSYVGLIIITGLSWASFGTTPEILRAAVFTVSFGFTIFVIVLSIILLCLRKKIRLVTMLLKEATKVIFDMPGLIALPVICVIVTTILTIIFCITILAMNSAGTLRLLQPGFYYYAPNSAMIFTIIYNFVIYLWLTQFFTGIQYMVIAGAVSKWYFSRDKIFPRSPILNSASIAFRYHLGSVALGGVIITIVQVIKAFIIGIINNQNLRACFKYMFEAIETLFRFLSKNAYIITALHGEDFIPSGRRAAKLILQNIKDIIAINAVGDFILLMAKILIILITLLLARIIFFIAPGNIPEANMMAYAIIAIVSTFVAFVAFGVFESTIDTLFICYCEDQILNDGMNRPYFMSTNLMEFVQNSKVLYEKEKQKLKKRRVC